MSRPDVRMDPRLGGEVLRWHTWPTLRTQNMANHQWNVARIALAIYPHMSRAVLIECLFHDVGEVGSGDHPTLAKTDPKFRQELHRLEDQCRLEMVIPWGLPSKHQLTDMELWVIKLADILDRWEFALHEVSLGNSLCREVVRNTEVSIAEKLFGDNIWPDVVDSVNWYMEVRRAAHAGR